MNKLRNKYKILCFSLFAGLALTFFGLPQHAAAAGETYEWSGNQIIGRNGNYTAFGDGRVVFNKQNEANTYLGFGFINGCGTAGAPRFTLKLTSATAGDVTTETRGCSDKFTPVNGPVPVINGSAPSGAYTVPAAAGAPAGESDDLCDNGEINDLNFFVCPVVELVAGTAERLDCLVLDLLIIDTDPVFGGDQGTLDHDPTTFNCLVNAGATIGNTDNDSQGNAATSDAFRTAWGVFRNIAFALLIIFGLVMIASQILGLEIFDAYTIRKMLPRLIIAVIFVSLSWNIMNFLFNFSNDAAFAIIDLIKGPFRNIDAGLGIGPGDINIAAMIPVILSVSVGVGVAFLAFLGIGGIAALILSVFLAVFVAFLLLAARTVGAYLLIIMAPLAIMCFTFEPFKKLFTLWKGLLTTILLSVPAVAAVIQMSHVGALIAFVSDRTTSQAAASTASAIPGPGGPMLAAIDGFGTIWALIILIAGYALIWTVFKKLDQVTGQLGNIASSVTGRIQKGLSQYRSNQLKDRFGRFTEGHLWDKPALQKAGLATGAFMRTKRKGELFKPGGMSKAIETQSRIAAARQKKTEEYEATQFDDEQQQAQTYASAEDARARMADDFHVVRATQAGETGTHVKLEGTENKYRRTRAGETGTHVADTAKIERGITQARLHGGFNRVHQIRALEGAAAAGTALVDWTDTLQAVERIAGGDVNIRNQLMARVKQLSVAAGRVDFGAGISDGIKAATEYHEAVAAGADEGTRTALLERLNREMLVKAGTAQDAVTILRGKPVAVEQITRAMAQEMQANKDKAVAGDRAAQDAIANMTLAMESLQPATAYASLDNTLKLRTHGELPTREIRENVERALGAEREVRVRLTDEQGRPLSDTAGNRLFDPAAPVEVQVQQRPGATITPTVTVEGGQGQAPAAPQTPQTVTVMRTPTEPSTPDVGDDTRGYEFGHNPDPTDLDSMNKKVEEIRELRNPYSQYNRKGKPGSGGGIDPMSPAGPLYPGA